jgi:hypothetical protein
MGKTTLEPQMLALSAISATGYWKCGTDAATFDQQQQQNRAF